MNEVAERPLNPFTDAPVVAKPAGENGALVAVEQQRVVAEVQAAMMIARMNPRDPIAATDRILNACTRPSLADAAVYQYSRGGSDVTGPSIRLAEAMAQSWGNIKTSVRELEQRGGVSTMQTIAWDLETGYQCDKVFQVPHLRVTKRGVTRLEDPRDIYELCANQAARRLRACILAVIPGDVTEAAVSQCETTMKAKADTSPEAVKKMLDAFGAYGVTKEQLEKRIQRHIDAIQPAQIVALKKIYASLRDGVSVVADWFDPVEQPAGSSEAPSAADKAKDAIKQRAGKKAPAADPATGEVPPPAQQPTKTLAHFVEQIDNAIDPDQARGFLKEAKDVLTPSEFDDLEQSFRAAWDAAD
jgi:hypothetical protein